MSAPKFAIADHYAFPWNEYFLSKTANVDAVRQYFKTQGYLQFKNFFSKSLMFDSLTEADRLYNTPTYQNQRNLRSRFQIRPRQGDSVLDAIDPVIDISPLYHQIAHHRDLMELLKAIFGTSACLFKDKLIYRPPGGAGQALHQDFISWPGFPKTFTTVMIALEPTRIENGCLEVFPGEHQRGNLSPEDGDYHDLSVAMLSTSSGRPIELEQGDILIFGAFLPHRSSDNLSNGPRRLLYLSYNSISDGAFQRTKHYREFHEWLQKRYAEYSTEVFHFS